MRPRLSDEERKARRKASWKKYHEANRDRLLAKAREKYAANPENEKRRHKEWASQNVDHLRNYNKQRYKSNPTTKKEQVRRWRRKNPEYNPSACKKWVANNPEKARASWRRMGLLRREAQGSFSNENLENIRRLQKGRCAYCRHKVSGRDEHIDHIIALAKGGTHDPSNLQILCESCNKSKSCRDPLEFVRSEYGYLL